MAVEVATVLALLYFAEAGVEIAVVEVGLGGRLDATNLITPLVSIITKIGHDHMHILGNTLAQIAAEKAGIIKNTVPVITAPQDPSALMVIERACEERNAPLHRVGLEWQWRGTKQTLAGQEFTVSSKQPDVIAGSRPSYKGLYVPLLGKHQLRNAAVVLATVEVLRSLHITVGETAVRQGLRELVWPARFEVLGERPYFVVDGAHNVDSAHVLAQTLQEYFPYKQPLFVLAILSDKDIPAILRELLPRARGAYFSRSPHPRAADPRQLEEEARRYAVPLQVIDDIGLATRRALEEPGPDGLVVAAGSFSTAGAAREAWLRLNKRPLPPLDPL